MFVPYVALFAFFFSWEDGEVVVGWWELIVNVIAVSLAPLLALVVPATSGATPLGDAARVESRPSGAGELGQHNRDAVRALIHAYDTRFIGL